MQYKCVNYKIIRTFVKNMNELSVLIPTFNDECLSLVKDLMAQCQKVFHERGEFEIIVADDGSTDQSVKEANKAINTLDNCRIIFRKKNAGRAAIRNFLVSEASYSTLLFIDSDMTVIRQDFISKYANNWSPTNIIYGGYEVPEQKNLGNNLRYVYERACRNDHTAERRQQHPYKDFHTSNFLVPRSVMITHPLDENYRNYGYEDVAYGEEILKAGIKVSHIDNPMGFCRFESNKNFIAKTEEGLRTLVKFRSQLEGYSRLLAVVNKLEKIHVLTIVRLTLKPWLPLLRKILIGNNTNVKLFNIYKLGYLLSII